VQHDGQKWSAAGSKACVKLGRWVAEQCPGLQAMSRLGDPHRAIVPGHKCLPRGTAQLGAPRLAFLGRLCLVTWAQQKTNFAASLALPEPLKLALKKKKYFGAMWSSIFFLFFFSHAHENSHSKPVTSAAPSTLLFKVALGGIEGELFQPGFPASASPPLLHPVSTKLQLHVCLCGGQKNRDFGQQTGKLVSSPLPHSERLWMSLRWCSPG